MAEREGTPAPRAAIIASWQRAHARLADLVDGLAEEEQTSPTMDLGWSVKDYLAHVTWWERRNRFLWGLEADPLAEFAAPMTADPEKDEEAWVQEVNDAAWAAHREEPLAVVRAAFDASYAAHLRALENLSDDAWAKGFADVDADFSDWHCAEHADILEEWIRKKSEGVPDHG